MLSIRVPKRPRARSLLLAAAATAGSLALVPAGATYALWNDLETISPGSITSGSTTLTIDKPALNAGAWSNLLPGQAAAEAFMVTNTGDVDTLLAASVTVSGSDPIAGYLILRLTPVPNDAACSTGLAGGISGTLTSFPPTAVADLVADTNKVICAEVKLDANAPIAVQGQTAPFAITLTATQK